MVRGNGRAGMEAMGSKARKSAQWSHSRTALRPLCNPSTDALRRQAQLQRPTSAEVMRTMSGQP